MEENTILCSSSGNNAGYINKYNTKVWASDCFAIISKDKNIINDYLYFILKIKQEEIFKYQNGSAQPHIYSSDLSKHLKLKIPKNKQLIKDLEPQFQEIEKLQSEIKEADVQYNQLIKELSEEAIPQQKEAIQEDKPKNKDKIQEKEIKPKNKSKSKNIEV
jgi:restriction endonuclease S subunit